MSVILYNYMIYIYIIDITLLNCHYGFFVQFFRGDFSGGIYPLRRREGGGLAEKNDDALAGAVDLDAIEPGKKLGFSALMQLAQVEQSEVAAAAEADMFGEVPSPRRAGRPAGRINRMTESQARACALTGQTPLSYLLSIMRDENRASDVRIQAAIAALPYLHRRQPQAVDLTSRGGMVLTFSTDVGGAENSEDVLGTGPAAELEGVIIEQKQ